MSPQIGYQYSSEYQYSRHEKSIATATLIGLLRGPSGLAMPTRSTVLVVDDDEVSRNLVQSLLAIDGYNVLFAEDGVQAMELAIQQPPDVVLLDIVMPRLDGFEVCGQLRSHPALQQVPIILLTALDSRSSRLRGLAAGADEFLTKPVDPAELRTRIRTITGLNRFRRLSEERARFEAAVNHSPDAIALTDRRGHILHANAGFHRLIGQAPESVIDCFPPATGEQLTAEFKLLKVEGCRIEPFEAALALSASPGATVEVSVARLPASDGVLLEVILRDITERKQLEAQLYRSQRIELLGELASGIVHDVNNLLMAIMVNAELLEESASGADRNHGAAIRQSAEQGIALLRRILMFARGGDQAMLPVDPAAVLHETASIVSKLMGPEVRLELAPDPDLPPILGDPNQLHQVLMNLCVNARDAMPDGGTVLLGARQISIAEGEARALAPDALPGEYVAMFVRDCGTGVPPEIRGRLFDPFFTTKPRETASGLGLATVLRIMRRHKGFVAFETQVNEGTSFTCYFPVIGSARNGG